MRRRELVALLGGAAVIWPAAARGQQPSALIGVLALGSPESEVSLIAAFRKGLAESGYVEGRNAKIEFRWAEKEARLPEFASDLVRRQVDVIVVPTGTPAVLAAKAATAAIPIVFNIGADPVQTGLVAIVRAQR